METLSEQEAAVYDRQIRVWGVDAQRRLSKARVLVVGITAVVAETCKNIVLAGVGSVTLLDDTPLLSSAARFNFLIPSNKLHAPQKETIASVCVHSLRDYNPLVNVSVETGDIGDKSEEFWDDYDAVVLGAASLDLRIRINALCRSRPRQIAFYAVHCRGFCGEMFVDLQKHSYTQKKQGEENSDVEESNFPSLKEALTVRWERLPKRTSKIFFAMRVVEEFEQARAQQPGLVGSDGSDILAFSHKLCQAQGLPNSLIPANLLQRMVDAGNTELPPVCAILGGILGQEILRALSGRGEPLRNFFFFDAMDGKGVIETVVP